MPSEKVSQIYYLEYLESRYRVSVCNGQFVFMHYVSLKIVHVNSAVCL